MLIGQVNLFFDQYVVKIYYLLTVCIFSMGAIDNGQFFWLFESPVITLCCVGCGVAFIYKKIDQVRFKSFQPSLIDGLIYIYAIKKEVEQPLKCSQSPKNTYQYFLVIWYNIYISTYMYVEYLYVSIIVYYS